MTTGQSPEAVGPFQLLRVIATDARGTVYEAVDPSLDHQRLAVRILPRQLLAPGAEAQARLRTGCLAAAELHHPNIVAVHASGWHGESAFVATALVEGESLSQYLARVGRLPALQGLALSAQLLSALELAHDRGLVHAAIDADHLLVSRTGQLLVTGFGWAGAAAALSARPGTFDASPYTAPEQVVGLPPDHRADLYSAAVVAYKLLTGALPFEANAVQPSAPQARRGIPLPVRAANPELPGDLDAVFQRALSRSPGARHARAADLLAALRTALGNPVWQRTGEPATALARIDAPVQPREAPSHAAVLPRVTPHGVLSSPLAQRLELGLAAACLAAVVWVASLAVGGAPAPAPASGTLVEARPPAVESPGERREAAGPVEGQVMVSAPAPLAMPLVETPAVAPVVEPVAPPAALEAAPAPPQQAPQQSPGLARTAQEGGTPMPTPVASGRGDAAPRGALQPASNRGAEQPAAVRRPVARNPRPARVAVPSLNCGQGTKFTRELCTVFRCAAVEFREHPVCVQMFAVQRERREFAASHGAP
jgi:eukaryotic-like serine/threonine-protein kinase